MPVESYATLINQKLVIPSSKTAYVAVEREFWAQLLASHIADIPLDEAWYCTRYPDIAEAIRNGSLASAKQHYLRLGYFEHRMPYAITVDERWYLNQYADVGTAIAQRLFASAQGHFEEVGFKEGRLPYPGFVLGRPGQPAA